MRYSRGRRAKGREGKPVIDIVNSALLEMQGALLARSLYPEGHPRIRVCEDRARESLNEVLRRNAEITLFAIDNRVVTGTEFRAPSLSELADIGDANGSRICDIVTCLSNVVSASASTMIPLAPLKRHDEYTFVHTMNVAVLSTSLAEAVGFDRQDAHEVSIAALLHDVGKQAIPETILNKNGRFTDQERAIMELHPVEGARMLLNTPGVPELAAVVAYEHHIRVDGSGYPAVPKNWRLSLASRVVQIADVFDALRTHRPYRAGMPVPKIVELMRNDVGLFFDADLLHVFLTRVIARGIPEEAAALTMAPASVSETHY